MHVSLDQLHLMRQFADPDKLVIDCASEKKWGPQRAVVIGVLWELLTNPAVEAVIISSELKNALRFLEMLKRYSSGDAALSSICKWPSWSRMTIGSDGETALRYISNHVSWLKELPLRSRTFIVLDAGNTNGEFAEMLAEVERMSSKPDCRLVRIW